MTARLVLGACALVAACGGSGGAAESESESESESGAEDGCAGACCRAPTYDVDGAKPVCPADHPQAWDCPATYWDADASAAVGRECLFDSSQTPGGATRDGFCCAAE